MIVFVHGFLADSDSTWRSRRLSYRILDAVCLTGPLTRCREQLAAFRGAGVDMPILVAPIGVDGARAVIKAFRR